MSIIKKGETNLGGNGSNTGGMPSVEEYRSSPQKISKYERNEFKRPVVIQGALKRGAKHTMESIEEEDEN